MHTISNVAALAVRGRKGPAFCPSKRAPCTVMRMPAMNEYNPLGIKQHTKNNEVSPAHTTSIVHKRDTIPPTSVITATA